jgi:hypothetical protein
METSGQLHAPDALLPGKEPPVPTGRVDEEEKSQPQPGIEPGSSSP